MKIMAILGVSQTGGGGGDGGGGGCSSMAGEPLRDVLPIITVSSLQDKCSTFDE